MITSNYLDLQQYSASNEQKSFVEIPITFNIPTQQRVAQLLINDPKIILATS
jgi:hypothetical protein